MPPSIYQAIHDARLDNELESILMRLLRFNSTTDLQKPIRQFLQDYKLIYDNYWNSFQISNTLDDAFECYYQYSKNKCILTENLLENLNVIIHNEDYNDLALLMRESLTF